jgi:glycerol-3-phosphate dehydrogenase
MRGDHQRLAREAVVQREPRLDAAKLRGGLRYWDCQVNSARLVLENLLDAETRGASLANYVEAHIEGQTVNCRDALSGEEFPVHARSIVDATGAWSNGAQVRRVRGSHLVFPRIQNSREAIAHFDDQGRVVFLIPWGEEDNLTLVGTTDEEHRGSPDDVHISPEEREYLLGAVHRLFPSFREEPIASYSSLRPLISEPGRSVTANSRRHRIWRSSDGVWHIAGGKYTTYRAMSEELVDHLLPNFPSRTAQVPLNTSQRPSVRTAVEREYARHLADFLYVSTYRGYERRPSPDWLMPLAREMGDLLGWDEHRVAREVQSVTG